MSAALPGNADKYNAEQQQKHAGSPLEGKTIIFLGSSVTYGAAAEGQSFVELFEAVDGVKAIKEAVSGTTLVDKDSALADAASGNGDSYIKRLRKLDTATKADCVVVQLSTNDATLKMPLGEISGGTDLGGFDTQTVTGALEWIIRYSRDTWNCPVVFYTGSWYESAEYAAMVDRLKELQRKWGIGVIDLYTDEAFNAIEKEAYDLYMADPIHPTKPVTPNGGSRRWRRNWRRANTPTCPVPSGATGWTMPASPSARSVLPAPRLPRRRSPW